MRTCFHPLFEMNLVAVVAVLALVGQVKLTVLRLVSSRGVLAGGLVSWGLVSWGLVSLGVLAGGLVSRGLVRVIVLDVVVVVVGVVLAVDWNITAVALLRVTRLSHAVLKWLHHCEA